MLVDIGKGVHVAPSDSITVAAAAQQWLARLKAEGRERATLQGYEQHVRAYIVPHIGRVKLAKLTALTVEGFRDQLLKAVADGDQRLDAKGGKNKRPLSRATARKVFTSFKMLLKSAKVAHVAADVSIAASKRERRLEPGLELPGDRRDQATAGGGNHGTPAGAVADRRLDRTAGLRTARPALVGCRSESRRTACPATRRSLPRHRRAEVESR